MQIQPYDIIYPNAWHVEDSVVLCSWWPTYRPIEWHPLRRSRTLWWIISPLLYQGRSEAIEAIWSSLHVFSKPSDPYWETLETWATTLETDSFICALRRFVARQGPARQMRSDCGTNFVGAEKEFKQALVEMEKGIYPNTPNSSEMDKTSTELSGWRRCLNKR